MILKMRLHEKGNENLFICDWLILLLLVDCSWQLEFLVLE